MCYVYYGVNAVSGFGCREVSTLGCKRIGYNTTGSISSNLYIKFDEVERYPLCAVVTTVRIVEILAFRRNGQPSPGKCIARQGRSWYRPRSGSTGGGTGWVEIGTGISRLVSYVCQGRVEYIGEVKIGRQ